MDQRITMLEEKIAQLQRAADEMSDMIAAQGREIDLLTRRVAMLMEREARREAETDGAVHLADQKPPHW